MHHFRLKNDVPSELMICCKVFFFQILHNEGVQEVHENYIIGVSVKIIRWSNWAILGPKGVKICALLESKGMRVIFQIFQFENILKKGRWLHDYGMQ